MHPHERDMVAKLVDDPAWKALEKRLKEHRKDLIENLGAALFGAGLSVDADKAVRQIVYRRGFIAGMLFFLRQPAASLDEIQRELKKAEEGTTDGESQN